MASQHAAIGTIGTERPASHALLSVLLAGLALVAGCSSPVLAPTPSETTAFRPVPAEAINRDVTQETIHQTICIAGYTASVRPSTSYTNGVKKKLLQEQSIPVAAAGEYELDHRIPLALGGHPRSLMNLTLQPWEGNAGARKKDQLERRLQRLVCADALRLDTARSAIYFDWRAADMTYAPR